MIKTIIVDDELTAIKSLKWEIENFCSDIEVIDSFTNPLEAISAINYLKPDFVHLFQDGKIQKTGSLDLAQQIENEGYAEFCPDEKPCCGKACKK